MGDEIVSFMLFADENYPDGFMLVRVVTYEDDEEGFATHVMGSNGIWKDVTDDGDEFQDIIDNGDYPKWAKMPEGD